MPESLFSSITVLTSSAVVAVIAVVGGLALLRVGGLIGLAVVVVGGLFALFHYSQAQEYETAYGDYRRKRRLRFRETK